MDAKCPVKQAVLERYTKGYKLAADHPANRALFRPYRPPLGRFPVDFAIPQSSQTGKHHLTAPYGGNAALRID